VKRAVLLSVVTAMIAVAATPAEAQSRRPYPGWQDDARDRYEDRKNRRQARRAGVAAAIVVSGVAKSVRRNEIEERYEECIRFDYYDVDCDRQRYRDLERSRKQARRSGLVAGIVTREIVRD
jgi:hypothetical protein